MALKSSTKPEYFFIELYSFYNKRGTRIIFTRMNRFDQAFLSVKYYNQNESARDSSEYCTHIRKPITIRLQVPYTDHSMYNSTIRATSFAILANTKKIKPLTFHSDWNRQRDSNRWNNQKLSATSISLQLARPIQ